jgi:hypothetical protein
MSVSVTLKEWLKDKIEALASVQKVYGYEPSTFDGWPAVTITLPEVDGEFASNAENSRVFAFNIRVYFPFGKDVETPKTLPREEYAENVVATVIEDILDDLDDRFAASDLGIPSDYTAKFWNATNSRPFYVETESGWVRGAEITISIYTEKTVV